MTNTEMLRAIMEGRNTTERLTLDIVLFQSRQRILNQIHDLKVCGYIESQDTILRSGAHKAVYAVTDKGLEFIEELEATE